MKKEDLTKVSVEDLKARIATTSEQLTKMKIGHAVTPLENPLQIRAVRRTIARLNTELKQRETQA